MKFTIQKTTMWNRIAAALLDFIIIMIVVTGVALLVSWITGYDEYSKQVEEAHARYEQEFGIKIADEQLFNEKSAIVTSKRAHLSKQHNNAIFGVTPDKFLELSAEQKAVYTGSNYEEDYNAMMTALENDSEYKEALVIVEKYNALDEAIKNDKDITYATGMMLSLSLVIITLGFLGGYLIVDFIIPLIFKNGQTIGKKIFGIAVMHPNGVRVNAQYMFIRTVLGKFTIETMIPIFIFLLILFGGAGIIGTITLIAIPVIEIILLTKYKETRYTIHDLLAKTTTVDIKSQQFFNSEEELEEFKKQAAAEEAAKSKYF